MTKKQIEQKAKEMANKYPAVGVGSKYHREIYAAAMEMAEWLLSHQWVSVEDKLPPKKNGDDYSDRVIIITEPLIISASCYDYDRHRWLCGYAVTHWMPIPPLVEEGGEK